jgi:hypothetical protein
MFARFLLACFVAGCAPVNRDDVDIKRNAKAQANEIQTALVKGDFEKVADCTHPKVAEAMGGKAKMVAIMTDGTMAMKKRGIEFKAVRIFDPSDPVEAGGELYILVPFKLEMRAPGKRLETNAAIVGISSDGGETWAFVDTTPGREELKKLFPDMPDSLDIPKKQAPKVIDD